MPSRQETRRTLSPADKLALLRRHPLFGALAPELLDRPDFPRLLRSQPELALKLREVLCPRLRHTSEQVEDVLFLDLPGRLAKILLQLAERAKLAQAPKLAITQREIGQMIGMSRES